MVVVFVSVFVFLLKCVFVWFACYVLCDVVRFVLACSCVVVCFVCKILCGVV